MTMKRLLVFLAGFLLFALEPLAGKMILPATGGGAHTWSTTLMFFQGALVVGYLYSHFLGPRMGRWHFLVACAPLGFLPVAAAVNLNPATPELSILIGLAAGVGLPFILLSTTSVLAQCWATTQSTPETRNPYTLYAASNAGSLLGLLAYPLLMAPLLTLHTQSWLWSAGYLLYLGLLWRCLPEKGTATAPSSGIEPSEKTEDAAHPWRRILAWFLLSATPSVLLLAVTAFIAQLLGSVPLIWVVPLALYLLSFILVFSERAWVPTLLRRFWFEISVLGVFLFFVDQQPEPWSVFVHLLVLFVVSLAAHSALYESRPAPAKLTGFYLVVALGGWAGAAFVAFAAPRLFDSVLEYPIAVGGVVATLLSWRWRPFTNFLRNEPRLLLVGSLAFLVFVGVQVAPSIRSGLQRAPAENPTSGILHQQRNAYGVYQVKWFNNQDQRVLVHNSIEHGAQNLAPDLRRQPMGYYASTSPLGEVMRILPTPSRAAVVGLGTGAAAAYFTQGEELTFYELDPHVVEIAQTYFSYLEDCEADIKIEIGDARVQLARSAEPDGAYQVILLDAFSGDSIPTHLLTREAMELYFRKLAPGGYLVFHISSLRLDLRPVLRAAGDAVGAYGAYRIRNQFLGPWEARSKYYVLSRESETLEPLLAMGWVLGDDASGLPVWSAWTDDYVNLLKPILAASSGKR